MEEKIETLPVFGVSKQGDGYDFALFAPHAPAVQLVLFCPERRELPLDRIGDVWHVHVPKLPPHTLYAYQIDGQLLLDPYARQVEGVDPYLGVVDPLPSFDWGEERAPNLPLNALIIYEMHVGGFTRDPSSSVEKPGTFAGMIEKIPYLKSLGVNAVELMPIFEFENPDENVWGYATVNYFAPMHRYGTPNDFKALVKALHAEGIEVILDVVYNHTAEGNHLGPTFSFKGLANDTYYMLTPNGEYYNFSGCGNTLNCNAPIVQQLICDSLRYWVTEMHVDGFRFDLASIFSRGSDGTLLDNPPIIEAISRDPTLSKAKLIAEAWDAVGLYQVGSFPGGTRWSEWNGKYRDEVRRFIQGNDGAVGPFATRLCGSEDLYQGGHPTQSVNFITAHDGYTLADLVSHDLKQHKNHLLALLLARGVPMMLMGDEYGHSKEGNHNSWNVNGRINWFQWDTLEQNEELFRFVQEVIAFRKEHPILSKPEFFTEKEIEWHGLEPHQPNWGPENRFVAYTLGDLYVAFNAYHYEVVATLPASKSSWQQCLYTAEGVVLDTDKVTLPPYSALSLSSTAL